MPLADLGKVLLAYRAGRAMQHILEEFSRSPGRIEEQHLARLGAGALPGMRDVARHEGAGAGPANGDGVADLERDLAAENIGDFVAVAMEVHGRHGPDRSHLLEHHQALLRLAVLQFERCCPTRRHISHRPLPWQLYDTVRVHGRSLPVVRSYKKAPFTGR